MGVCTAPECACGSLLSRPRGLAPLSQRPAAAAARRTRRGRPAEVARTGCHTAPHSRDVFTQSEILRACCCWTVFFRPTASAMDQQIELWIKCRREARALHTRSRSASPSCSSASRAELHPKACRGRASASAFFEPHRKKSSTAHARRNHAMT